jgi:hypothetical protein
VTFYVNGKLVDQVKINSHQPGSFGSAAIGYWNSVDFSTPERMRNLRGRVDELIVFRRPLAAEEIQRMYDAGKPEEKDRSSTQP